MPNFFLIEKELSFTIDIFNDEPEKYFFNSDLVYAKGNKLNENFKIGVKFKKPLTNGELFEILECHTKTIPNEQEHWLAAS
tara:strand:- start:343 stop:585 length:243 start_codon:yes stop_codon:yes gene_type:complete